MWRRGAGALLSQRVPGAVAGWIAAARRHALAVVYHRVRPEPQAAHEVVPCVPVDQFRAHVEALSRLGDIVPLNQLLEAWPSSRPRFALTFDDDYATHARHVLPVLLELRVPATFFLSGRSLHGLGPYWWEILEDWIRHDGPERVANALDVPHAEPHAMAAVCEEDPERRQYLEANAGDLTDQLRSNEIAALATAGMTIGFHTVAHTVLPSLGPESRHVAMTHGRDRLQEVTGQSLTQLAYPHGRADAATAVAAQAAGYEGAWTGEDRAISRRSHRWLLGRWEAGPVDPSVLRARALARLLRSVPAHD